MHISVSRLKWIKGINSSRQVGESLAAPRHEIQHYHKAVVKQCSFARWHFEESHDRKHEEDEDNEAEDSFTKCGDCQRESTPNAAAVNHQEGADCWKQKAATGKQAQTERRKDSAHQRQEETVRREEKHAALVERVKPEQTWCKRNEFSKKRFKQNTE